VATAPPATLPGAVAQVETPTTPPPVVVPAPTFPTPVAPPTPAPVPVAPVARPVAVAPTLPITPAPASPAVVPGKSGELPPISLSVNNASLAEVVQALNTALNMPGALIAQNSGNTGQTYTLEVKNRPFWEVIQVLNAQNPFTISNTTVSSGSSVAIGGTTGGFGGTTGSGTTSHISLNPSPESLRLARISGPIIVFPRTMSYSKTGTGIAGAAPTPGRYMMNAYAIVDPRITVAAFEGITITEVVDEAGRTRNAPSSINISSSNTNFMSIPMQWTENDTPSKTISLKAEVRFSAQTQSTEVTATVEDAQTKNGDLITLGDRRVRLARFNVNGSTLQVELAPETPGPLNSPVSYTITDATGKSILSVNNRPLNSVSAASIANATGPYRLALRAPDHTQTFAIPFEFRNLPLP